MKALDLAKVSFQAVVLELQEYVDHGIDPAELQLACIVFAQGIGFEIKIMSPGRLQRLIDDNPWMAQMSKLILQKLQDPPAGRIPVLYTTPEDAFLELVEPPAAKTPDPSTLN